MPMKRTVSWDDGGSSPTAGASSPAPRFARRRGAALGSDGSFGNMGSGSGGSLIDMAALAAAEAGNRSDADGSASDRSDRSSGSSSSAASSNRCPPSPTVAWQTLCHDLLTAPGADKPAPQLGLGQLRRDRDRQRRRVRPNCLLSVDCRSLRFTAANRRRWFSTRALRQVRPQWLVSSSARRRQGVCVNSVNSSPSAHDAASPVASRVANTPEPTGARTGCLRFWMASDAAETEMWVCCCADEALIVEKFESKLVYSTGDLRDAMRTVSVDKVRPSPQPLAHTSNIVAAPSALSGDLSSGRAPPRSNRPAVCRATNLHPLLQDGIAPLVDELAASEPTFLGSRKDVKTYCVTVRGPAAARPTAAALASGEQRRWGLR